MPSARPFAAPRSSVRVGSDAFAQCSRFLFASIFLIILVGAPTVLLPGGDLKSATYVQEDLPPPTKESTGVALPPSPDEPRKPYCSVVEVNPNGNVTVIRPSLEPIVNAPVLGFFKERVKDAVREYGPFGRSFYFDLDTSDVPTCIGRMPKKGETCRDMNTEVGCCSSGRPLVGVSRNICCNCSLPLPIHGNQIKQSLASVVKERDPYGWKDKKGMAVWHGSGTGHREYAQFYARNFNLEKAYTIPRQKIVQISQQHPDLLHASMTKHPWKDLLQYKFIVTVSGYAYAGILKSALMSNSCVLRQDAIATEWYEPWLKRWVHFVPVKYDLSDLVERIRWAKQHDKECEKIASEGRKFALEHFDGAAVNKYVHSAINAAVKN